MVYLGHDCVGSLAKAEENVLRQVQQARSAQSLAVQEGQGLARETGKAQI